MDSYIYNIGSFFSQVSSGNKDRIALKYPDGKTVSFFELEILSNQIAHYFIAHGLQKEDVIAIFNNKSPLGYATMLAALKIGVIYTNLDLTSPYERIKKIVERCRPKLLLFDIPCDFRNDLAQTGIQTIDLYEKTTIHPYLLLRHLLRVLMGRTSCLHQALQAFPKGLLSRMPIL